MHPIRLPFAALFVLASCTDPEPGFEDLDELEQSLNGAPSLRYTGNPVMIPVCWESPDDSRTAVLDDGSIVGEATLRSWARAVVEGQWSRYARVNFTQWDTCTAGEAGIHISIMRRGRSSSGFGPKEPAVNLNLYFDERVGDPCRANRAGLERCTKAVALHEFGHSLGFGHQENRADYVQTDPNIACLKQNVGADQLLGAYDLASVMSYCGQPYELPQAFKTLLSPSDIASVQAVYGRRLPGQVVGTRGADMLANNIVPNPSFLWDADEAPGQLWTYNWARQAFEVQTGGRAGCLDAYPGAFDGSPLVAFSCFYDSYQKFRFDDVSIRGFGGLCLETPGMYANGTEVRIGKCSDDGSERWAIDTSKRIRLIGTQKCLTWSSNIGAAMTLWDCGASTAQSFDFRSDGSIAFASNLCLDANGPSTTTYLTGTGLPVDGSRAFTYYCGYDRQLTQRWNLSGRITHGSGLCVDHQSSNSNGSTVLLRTCNGSESQRWDYYWR